MQETKDGHIWGFEVGDMAMDVAGAAFAVAMENLPQLDRLIDFRMSWVPSSDFRKLWAQHPWSRGDGVDFTQDYTGMTFQLAVHMAPLTDVADELWWTQWVDVVGGFEAKGFEPAQMPMRYTPYQDFYLGIGVNLQGIIDHTLSGKLRAFGHGFTEVFAVPGQVLRLGEERRTRSVTAEELARERDEVALGRGAADHDFAALRLELHRIEDAGELLGHLPALLDAVELGLAVGDDLGRCAALSTTIWTFAARLPPLKSSVP